MKVSLNLAQYYSNVDLKKVANETWVELIGAQLGAVEETVDWAAKYKGIVVVKIISAEQHPNADRLRVCLIDDGGVVKGAKRDKNGLVQVVCGAPNARKDIIVAWLSPGTTVPSTLDDNEPFVLEARELRGVVSNGMLASPKELGISDEHDGILEIDPGSVGRKPKPGEPLTDYYGLDDYVIDCENKMFTHRPDCFGVLGVARELAGITGQAFKSPSWYSSALPIENSRSQVIKGLSIKNEIPELVPCYSLVAVENIKVAPSPIWLQACLTRLGIRPINNIVDMTNYLMALTGQPLHAFDFDKIAVSGEAKIVIRKPKPNDEISLLDGRTIKPRSDAILICDDKNPIALGGVMGSNNSEIDESTTRILIESANFDMFNIRRTSMEHGIFTDAVTRFTKGQSPWQCQPVLAKAVHMLTEELSLGSKSVGRPVVIMKHPVVNQTIKITADFINSRLGTELNLKEVTKILENVEFKVVSLSTDKNHLHITAPFWRTDIEIPEDIVEEVGRLYGYAKLLVSLPPREAKPVEKDPKLSLKMHLRYELKEMGGNELLTYSFVHENLLKKVTQDSSLAFHIRNALSPDLQYYRLSITPSLLDKVHANIKNPLVGEVDKAFCLYELGRGRMSTIKNKEGLPAEYELLAGVIAASDKTAAKKYDAPAFFQAKHFLSSLGRGGLKFAAVGDQKLDQMQQQVVAPFDQDRAALVIFNDEIVGIVGEYKPTVVRQFKLPKYCAGFEVLQSSLAGLGGNTYKPLVIYPKVEQDITLEVGEKTSFGELESSVRDSLDVARQEKGYHYELLPLDIYKTKDGGKRFSFRIWLWHGQKTLLTEEVNALLEDIAAKTAKKLNAKRI